MREPVATVTWARALAWRTRRQHLDARVPPAGALAVVERLGGLHAQLMSSAELTLWARVEALEPDAVATALWVDRTLVKTWAMRGTLHLLPAAGCGCGPRRWEPGSSATTSTALVRRPSGSIGSRRCG